MQGAFGLTSETGILCSKRACDVFVVETGSRRSCKSGFSGFAAMSAAARCRTPKLPNTLQTVLPDRGALKDGSRQHSTFSTLVFQPPLVIKNSMPCAMQIQMPDKQSTGSHELLIGAGGTSNVYSVNTRCRSAFDLIVKAPDLCPYSSPVTVLKRDGHVAKFRLASADGEQTSGNQDVRAVLAVSVDTSCDQVTVEVLSPCWLINKANITLQMHTHVKLRSREIRAEDIFLCEPTALRRSSDAPPALLGQLSTSPLCPVQHHKRLFAL